MSDPNPTVTILDHSDLVITAFEGNTVARSPNVGDISVIKNSDKLAVYTGTDWKEITPPDAEWEMRYYVMRDNKRNPVGIFNQPMDTKSRDNFTLFQPGHEPLFQPLIHEYIERVDYETQVMFGTFPELEVKSQSVNGVLLKFPD